MRTRELIFGTGTFTLDEEGRAFLQSRLALLAKVTFALSGGFLAASVLITAVSKGIAPAVDSLAKPGRALNGVGSLVSLLLWLLTTRGKRSAVTLARLDLTLTTAALVIYALMALEGEKGKAGVFLIALCTSIGLSLRAALVPSPTVRTGAVALIVVLAIAGVSYVVPLPLTPAEPATRSELRVLLTLWLIVAATASVVLSAVIFGLRREADRARKLGQYTLLWKIGEGGMGAVYRARHSLLRRPSAIKLLDASRASAQAVARFEREVQLTASLLHPNTVKIFDYGRTAAGQFYYAMELIDGGDLDDIVHRSGPQDPRRVVHILDQIAGSLEEAHRVGLVHRDIKPGNILLSAERVPDLAKLADFGLVMELRDREERVVGTPLFMAPEAIAAPESVDGRSDLYAFGAVGYYLLTGEPVFEADTIAEVCRRHLSEEPMPASVRLGAPVPAGLEAVIMACLAKDPSARPPTASVVRAALKAIELPPWTSEEAEAWWATHPEPVGRRKREFAGTLEIRLDERRNTPSKTKTNPARGIAETRVDSLRPPAR